MYKMETKLSLLSAAYQHLWGNTLSKVEGGVVLVTVASEQNKAFSQRLSCMLQKDLHKRHCTSAVLAFEP